MSTINITFDSVTKALKVDLDGAEVDANGVYIYKNRSGLGEISIDLAPETVDGVTKRQTIYASESEEVNNLTKTKASEDGTLVKVSNLKDVKDNVNKWLSPQNNKNI